MSSDAATALKIAIATYGHTAALKEGAVAIDGVKADFVEIKPIIAAFRRMVRTLEFDVCEMAPATYMIARAHGAPFKALPVFIFRRFHHAGMVYRPDSGIHGPKDLEGKRAGVRAYSVTTGIWTRGILAEEYGVDNSKITWVVDDEEHVKTLRLPPNVQPAPDSKSLVDLMGNGYLSAAFTDNAGIGRAGAPADGWTNNGANNGGEASAAAAHYQELIPDAPAREAEWFARTGIYPIHGLIVIKESVLKDHPHVARALYDAFEASRQVYLRQLEAGQQVSDKDDHYRSMARIVGDPLPYGIEPNRQSIEALIRYCHAQGLLDRRFAVEEMFIDPYA